MRILILLVMCSIAYPVLAQTPYKDAIKLSEFILPGGNLDRQNDSVFLVLNNYVAKDDRGNRDSISIRFNRPNTGEDSNPFIEISGGGHSGLGTLSKTAGRFLSANVGGLDVTTAAEGIAQFMISRAKEELTISFFNRFKKCVEANPEIQVMFPKTTITLRNLLTYQYPEMLPSLQKAFYSDLRLLPIHLDDVLELPKYKELLINFPEVKIAIHSIRIIGQLESAEMYPSEIIDEVADLHEWDDPAASTFLKNMGSCIRLGDIFSKSLSLDSLSQLTRKTPWISSKELKKLVQDTVALKIYLGLIYQQVTHIGLVFPNATSRKITFTKNNGSSISFAKILASNKENLILFQSKLSEFIQLTEELKATFDDINANRKNTVDDYYNYVNQGIDVIEYSFDLVRIFDNEFIANDYVKIARSGNDLYRNIYKKEYSAAILNAVDIFNEIELAINQSTNKKTLAVLRGISASGAGDKELEKIVKDAQSTSSLSQRDIKALKKNLKSNIRLTSEQKESIISEPIENALDSLTKVIPEILKYGLFIANVASAETADEVESIISAAVLPVGSFSIKKNSIWNVSVQSYLGAYWRVSRDQNSIGESWNDKFGVIAPIGFAVSYGLQKKGSISFFGSLLDLGAMVDYKLKYDTIVSNNAADVQVNKDYIIELGQIFSPGGYIVYGFGGNLPLSIGFGGQYGPGLSSIDSKGNAVVDNPYWRWNAFLAVDIPLFNIHNRERKYSKKERR